MDWYPQNGELIAWQKQTPGSDKSIKHMLIVTAKLPSKAGIQFHRWYIAKGLTVIAEGHAATRATAQRQAERAYTALELEAAHQDVEEDEHQYNQIGHTAVTAARKAVRMIAAAAWDEGYRYSETHLECEDLEWGSGDTCPGCPTCTPSNPYRNDELWSDEDDLTHDYQNISS